MSFLGIAFYCVEKLLLKNMESLKYYISKTNMVMDHKKHRWNTIENEKTSSKIVEIRIYMTNFAFMIKVQKPFATQKVVLYI